MKNITKCVDTLRDKCYIIAKVTKRDKKRGERMPDRNKIAEKLRELRGDKSREEVANACGISVSAITMYEIGERIPRDEVKVRLAKFYGVNVEDIFFAEQCHEK